MLLAVSTNIVERSCVYAQDDEGLLDIALIINTLKEEGFEVNQSMVLTAVEHPFRDLVITGDEIQGNILSKTEPIAASVDVEVAKSENASLAGKTSKYVSVLIVADEEYISIYSDWKSRTWSVVEKIDDYFIEQFGLDFVIVRFEQYYSDDSLSGAHELFYDVMEKVNKKDANIMVAFCGQYSGSIGGTAEPCGDDIIIFHNSWHSWYQVDNIVQHELSHLFNALDHNPGWLDWCVMSYSWNALTHRWCSDCYQRMKKYIDEVAEFIDGPLIVYTDKYLYVPEENVEVTIQNGGEDALALMKWSVEKRALSGAWDKVYESSRFFAIIPVNDSSSFVWNVSDLGTDEFILINWSENNTFVDDFWNTTVEYNPGDSFILINLSEEGYDFGNITLWQGDNTLPSPIPPTIPVTMLQPNRKLTWSWPQKTSDGKKAGFGEYRIKIDYDDKYATSPSFSITVVVEFSEHPIVWKPSINFTHCLATDLSIGMLSISETPSFVYNSSSTVPIIETIVNLDVKPSKVKITSDVLTGRITVEVNNEVATTMKPLTIDNSSLLMSTSSGYKEVKIMPDTVGEKAGLISVENIELKEFNNKPVYQVKGTRESKLLWFIPVDMDVTIHLDAGTGAEEKIERPWWGFLGT